MRTRCISGTRRHYRKGRGVWEMVSGVCWGKRAKVTGRVERGLRVCLRDVTYLWGKVISRRPSNELNRVSSAIIVLHN